MKFPVQTASAVCLDHVYLSKFHWFHILSKSPVKASFWFSKFELNFQNFKSSTFNSCIHIYPHIHLNEPAIAQWRLYNI